jgi:hypothetical protein
VALAVLGGSSGDHGGVGRSRYLIGWALVVALAVGVSLGSLRLVRSAVGGGGKVVASLSPADVSAQYAQAQTSAAAKATASAGSGTAPTPAAAPPTGLAEPTSGSAPADPDPGTGHATPGQTDPGHAGALPTSHPRPTSPPPSVTRVLSSPGGSVVVRCTGSGSSASVYLVSWSPAQGYSVDQAQRGPSEAAEIEFESDSGSVSVNYHCSSSGPVQTIGTGDTWGDDGGSSGGSDGGTGGGDS